MPNDDNLLSKNLAEEIYKQNLELLEQRRRTEELLYEVSEAVLAVDTSLNITIFNNAAEKMFGLKSKDVIGKSGDDIIKIESEKGVPIKVAEYCFQTDPEKALLRQVVLRTPIRGYYINLKASIIDQIKGQKECLLTMTDITKEVELDKTKDDFISVTSHELRTPITIIKSYLWMLENGKGGPLSDKQKEYCEKAINGAERLLNLINDTLNISRIENGKIEFVFEEIDLKKYISDLEQDFKIKTDEKGIELHVNIEQDLRNVLADRNKLREIFVNFFGNSFKFTTSGSITIHAENYDSKFAKITFTDTGKGISRDDIKRLFHKFGRLDNSYQTVAENAGTGLGLYIVKSLIEAMGGTVGAFSEGVGKGSSFWFTLPLVNSNLHENIETIQSIVPVKNEQVTTIVATA